MVKNATKTKWQLAQTVLCIKYVNVQQGSEIWILNGLDQSRLLFIHEKNILIYNVVGLNGLDYKLLGPVIKRDLKKSGLQRISDTEQSDFGSPLYITFKASRYIDLLGFQMVGTLTKTWLMFIKQNHSDF